MVSVLWIRRLTMHFVGRISQELPSSARSHTRESYGGAPVTDTSLHMTASVNMRMWRSTHARPSVPILGGRWGDRVARFFGSATAR